MIRINAGYEPTLMFDSGDIMPGLAAIYFRENWALGVNLCPPFMPTCRDLLARFPRHGRKYYFVRITNKYLYLKFVIEKICALC